MCECLEEISAHILVMDKLKEAVQSENVKVFVQFLREWQGGDIDPLSYFLSSKRDVIAFKEDIRAKMLEILVENTLNTEHHMRGDCLLQTPLLWACQPEWGEEFTLKTVRLLAKRGANMNYKNKMGDNALMKCCENGYEIVSKTLVELGVPVNECNNNKWGPLFFAAFIGNKNLVCYLISKGAKINVVDYMGRFPYDIALEKGYDDVAELLDTSVVKYEFNTFRSLPFFENAKKGFPDDVYRLMFLFSRTQPLYKYNGLFHEMPLDEFLRIDDKALKEIGIPFSAHRKAILDGIVTLHDAEFHPDSLGLKKQPSYDIRDCATFATNVLRQLHIIKGALSNCWNNRGGGGGGDRCEVAADWEKIIRHVGREFESAKAFGKEFREGVDDYAFLNPVHNRIGKEPRKRRGLMVEAWVSCFLTACLSAGIYYLYHSTRAIRS